MKTVINKNMKSIVLVAAVAAILLGGLLLLISGNETPGTEGADTDAITTELGETQPTDIQETTEAKVIVKKEKGNSEWADRLFAAGTDSIGNGEAIAKLAEIIGLEDRVAPYTMELQEKKTPKTITITFDTTVRETRRVRFDEKVQPCAEIMLALVKDADCIEWSYRVKKSDGRREQVTVFLRTEDASKLLEGNIKAYGTSGKAVRQLLEETGLR